MASLSAVLGGASVVSSGILRGAQESMGVVSRVRAEMKKGPDGVDDALIASWDDKLEGVQAFLWNVTRVLGDASPLG